VLLPSAVYDSQIDTWDVFRYGGSVTSWRFIGYADAGAAFFLDNYSDDAAEGGDELEFDNLEPWPSVDVPNNGGTGFGTGAANVYGTVALLFQNDPDITSYLPGTLIQFNNANVYTL